MSEPKGDAGQEGTKEQAMQLVRDLYEYFQGPHACGDFTCACGDVKSCGVCEMRVRTEKFLAEVPVSAPVPERTNRESALRLAYRAFEHLYDVDARNRRGQWQYSMGLFRTALSLAAPVPEPEQFPELAILRLCKCRHGWESHEPERCNESLCRCEEFRPVASPEAPAKVKLGTCKFGPIGNKRPHVRGSSCENWTSVAPALEERDKFLEFAKGRPVPEGIRLRADGRYLCVFVQAMWETWQARACLGLSGRAE